MLRTLASVFCLMLVACSAISASAADFAVRVGSSGKAAEGKTVAEREWLHAKVPMVVTGVSSRKGGDLWTQGLRISLRNETDKPIYFVVGAISFPETNGESGSLGYPLGFGREALMELGSRPIATDPAIAPGETVELRLSEGQARGLRAYERRYGINLSKADFSIQIAAFGDGTQWNAGNVWDRESLAKAIADYQSNPNDPNANNTSPCGKNIYQLQCGCGIQPCKYLMCGSTISNYGNYRSQQRYCYYELSPGDERQCTWQEVYDCSGPATA